MRVRYSRLKIFHFPGKLASLPRDIGEIRPPLHIRIKPTNACSHRCRYCAYRAPNLQLGRDMDPRESIPREKMLEIVEDLASMGVQAVTFSGGGDPFCYPHLHEAAERLAASGIPFAALTNGARLEGDAAALFARSAAWLRISMDGWDAPSYARYRGVDEEEFDRVIGNIRRFRSLGGACRLGINLVVDRENAPHVFDFIRMAKDLGADSIKISPCVIADSGAENNAYHRPFFADVNGQIARARETFESDAFEIYHAYHEQQTVFAKPYSWCPYLQILPVIGADMRVYTCQDKAYNRESGLLGSIEHERFSDFWMRNKAKFFDVNPSIHCNHHCVSDAKNRLVLEYLEIEREHLGFV